MPDGSPITAIAQGGPGWPTPKDIQRELRIGEKLAYRLLRDGTIPSVRVGNLYRVRREVIEELRDQAITESCA